MINLAAGRRVVYRVLPYLVVGLRSSRRSAIAGKLGRRSFVSRSDWSTPLYAKPNLSILREIQDLLLAVEIGFAGELSLRLPVVHLF